MAIFELLDYIVNEVSLPTILLHDYQTFILYLPACIQFSHTTFIHSRLNCHIHLQPPPKLPGIFSPEFQDFVNKWYVNKKIAFSAIKRTFQIILGLDAT